MGAEGSALAGETGDDAPEVWHRLGSDAFASASEGILCEGAGSGLPTDLPGRVREYRIVRLIGSGGMGMVFEAHDPELDRVVAVKILRAGREASDVGERRLRREGQTMARLTHPNVLRVYDVGVAHRRVFVAMEYVDGGTLGDWLAAEPRTVDEILAMPEADQGPYIAAIEDARDPDKQELLAYLMQYDAARKAVYKYRTEQYMAGVQPAEFVAMFDSQPEQEQEWMLEVPGVDELLADGRRARLFDEPG